MVHFDMGRQHLLVTVILSQDLLASRRMLSLTQPVLTFLTRHFELGKGVALPLPTSIASKVPVHQLQSSLVKENARLETALPRNWARPDRPLGTRGLKSRVLYRPPFWTAAIQRPHPATEATGTRAREIEGAGIQFDHHQIEGCRTLLFGSLTVATASFALGDRLKLFQER